MLMTGITRLLERKWETFLWSLWSAKRLLVPVYCGEQEIWILGSIKFLNLYRWRSEWVELLTPRCDGERTKLLIMTQSPHLAPANQNRLHSHAVRVELTAGLHLLQNRPLYCSILSINQSWLWDSFHFSNGEFGTVMFLKDVSYAYQSWFYLIKNTVKTKSLWNIIAM